MSEQVYFLSLLKIQGHGWNDGNTLAAQSKIILKESNDLASLTELKNQLDLEIHKNLEQYLLLDDEQKKLKPSLFRIDEKVKTNLLFYPVFNIDFWTKVEGISSIFSFYELDKLSDNLTSTNEEEAYEKGLFLLLMIFALPDFIGDPENSSVEYEYLDSLKYKTDYNLLKISKNKPNLSLISKHDSLKFYLLGINPFRIKEDLFKQFSQNKSEILGNQLDHFNELKNHFKSMSEMPIQIIEM